MFFPWAVKNGLNSLDQTGMKKTDAEFLWVDVETTGLNIHSDVILEVGAVLTDAYGYVCSSPFHRLVDIPQSSSWQSAISKGKEHAIVGPMHEESGLWEELEKSRDTYGPHQVEEDLTYWLKTAVADPKKIVIAGSSVKLDYYMLWEYMPDFIESIHYRDINSSTLKELCKRLNPRVYEGLDRETQPQKLHRVLPDLVDSIKEYQFYVDNFLYITGPPEWTGDN